MTDRIGATRARARCALVVALLSVLVSAAGCGSHQKSFLALDSDAKLLAARADLENGKWSRAASRYAILAGVFEGTLRYPEVKYGLGRAYAGMKDYPAAERELNVVLREHPDSEWADDALLAIAEAYAAQMRAPQLDQTATWQAIDKVREFLRRYPDSDRIAEAQALLARVRGQLAQKEYENGQLYLRLGDGIAARTCFDTVIADYADTPWAALAQFGSGEAFEKEERPDAAIAAYQEVVTRWPEHDLARASRERIRALEGREGGSS